MTTAVRVKLRPDTHYAPVNKGVYWSRPGGRSFVLSGPRSLFGLIDARLELLTAGTSVDDLVSSVDDEKSRPIFAHIVDTLLAQDMLFDVEAGGPAPDDVEAVVYADVIGYLEAHCARPYEMFARLRAARIAVVGDGPVAANLIRSLRGYGIGEVGAEGATPDLVALIDDAERRIDMTAIAAELLHGTTVLPVIAGVRMAVVGPAISDPDRLDAFLAASARFDGWLRAEDIAPAPRPLSAAFAGSLAARAVLDELLGLTGEAYATVVHGGSLECQRVPVALPLAEPRWHTWDDEDDVAEQPVPVTVTEAAADAPADQDPDAIHQQAAWLTSRWTGVARWGDDIDLPQLPVALATVRAVAAPDMVAREVPMHDISLVGHPAMLGWGIDRADAGADALLSLLRVMAGEQIPDQSGWVAAAGTSGRRFIVDGLLRLSAARLLQAPPERELAVGDAGSWIGRSLWNVLGDYFAVPVRLWLREAPGLTWPLVTATDDAGTVLSHQWGPTLPAAVHAALAAVTAACQLAEVPSIAAQLDPIGTWALRTAPARQVNECHAELIASTTAGGQRVTGRLLVNDAVGGVLPLCTGLVGLK